MQRETLIQHVWWYEDHIGRRMGIMTAIARHSRRGGWNEVALVGSHVDTTAAPLARGR